jgi:hypothetical protein
MGRIKSQLRHVGMWPESRESAHLQPVGLTSAATRLAESVIEELHRAGVAVTLDGEGRARFRPTYSPSRDTLAMIERHADLIQALLIERASRRGPP